MSAYLVFTREETLDPSELAIYKEMVVPTLACGKELPARYCDVSERFCAEVDRLSSVASWSWGAGYAKGLPCGSPFVCGVEVQPTNYALRSS